MTEIILEGYGSIKIADETYFALNFNVEDITTAGKSQANYSKDIEIKGDNDINKILKFCYDINNDNTFNITKRVKCDVIQNGSIVFSNGLFQLLSIETKTLNADAQMEIRYTARVKSNKMSLFSDVKNGLLSDLNLHNPSDYQQLTKANVLSSFTRTAEDRWKYIPHNHTGWDWHLKYFKPGIYAKTFFDAIHESNGWTYEFEELSDVRFDKLIIPSSSTYVPSQTLLDDVKVIATASSTQDYWFNGKEDFFYTDGGVNTEFSKVSIDGIPKYLVANVEETDPTIVGYDNYNIYNPAFVYGDITTPRITSAFKSNVSFTYKISYNLILRNPGGNCRLVCDPVVPDGDNKLVLSYRIFSIKPGVLSLNYSNFGIQHKIEQDVVFSPFNNTLQSGEAYFTTTKMMEVDEIISNIGFQEVWTKEGAGSESMAFKRFSDNTYVRVDRRLEVTACELVIQPQLEYNIGTPIYLNDYIPANIKQADFLRSIIDIYRLVAEEHPNIQNRVVYKTRDKFYDEGQEKDWTKKVNNKLSKTKEWLVNLQSAKRLFTYKSGDDSYNKTYLTQTGENYGQYLYDFGNMNATGEDKLELIFTSTPTLFKQDQNIFISAIPVDGTDNNIRLLYDGGLKTDAYWYIQNDDGTFDSEVDINYPVFSHFDNPVSPSFDVNFGVCTYYYYNNFTSTTNNNLFNLFHRRYIGQQTNGKMLTLFLDLNEADIANINLSDKIWIKDCWYNISKIIDYNANSKQPTKVELITIDDNTNLNFSYKKETQVLSSTGVLIAKPPRDSQDGIYSDNAVSADSSTFTRPGSSGNVLGAGSSGIVLGNNNNHSMSSIVLGNGNSSGDDYKLIVGNNIKSSSDFDAFIGQTKIGKNLNINETTYGESSIDYKSGYVIDDYVIDDFYDSYTSSIQFQYQVVPPVPGTGTATQSNTKITFNSKKVYMTDVEEIIGAEVYYPATYDFLNALQLSGGLDEGKTYYITDRDMWVQAINAEEFAIFANRRMRCPLQELYTSGTFSLDGVDYMRNGVYGQLYPQGTVPASTPSLTQIAVWGGKVWERNTDPDAGASSQYEIFSDEGWDLVPSDSDLYTNLYFTCEYDLENDNVVRQSDLKGNYITNQETTQINIDATDWNCPGVFDNENQGVFNNFNSASNTYAIVERNRNYGLVYFNDVEDTITNNTNLGAIYNNRCGNIVNNINAGSIYNNIITSNITGNSNGGVISDNQIVGAIQINSNATVISNNTCDGSIFKNSNAGSIQFNSNSGLISNNSNSAFIDSNSNAGGIYSNSNGGEIAENSNLGDIYLNSNGGTIYDNSTQDGIYLNSNLGAINQNSCDGVITGNKNSGNISDNSNAGAITYNINIGSILYNSNTYISNNMNDGNITNNSNSAEVAYNQNLGNIEYNSNNGFISSNQNIGNIDYNTSASGTMNIFDNVNNGDVTYNRNTASINIAKNINNGFVGNPGGPAVSRASTISDTIVNK